MPEFLDADIFIGDVYDSSGKIIGQVKGNAYFEELLFSYLEQMGGESENLIDNSVNIINTLPSTLEVKISQNQKGIQDLSELIASIRVRNNKDLEPQINDLTQLVESLRIPRNQDLEAQVKELSQLLESFRIQRKQDLEPRVEDLEQRVVPIGAKFDPSNIEQFAASSFSQISTLQAIVSRLSRDADKVQAFTTSGIILPGTDMVFASGSSVTLTMPVAATARKRVTIKNTDISNNIIIDTPGSELIEGFATATITSGTPGASHTYSFDGTEWRLV